MKKTLLALALAGAALPSVARTDSLSTDSLTLSTDSIALPTDSLTLPTDSIYRYNDPTLPGKRPWRAALETFVINAGVHSFDRFVLNEDFAKVTGSSIWKNIKRGFVWDNDQFSTNLFAHPYHGNLYFNSARTHGLTFFESVPYAFGGSLMWEEAGEVEPPAINDLIATTVGGTILGEVSFRLSNLVYDDRQRGGRRFARELLGTLINPIRGLNRLISGDAWRVRTSYYKYHDYERLPVAFKLSVGDRYLADNGAFFRGEHNPYIDLCINYGDPFNEEENKPYDYFTANISFGLSGNQPLINNVHLLGRLWGTPVRTGTRMEVEFGIFQHFNYYDSSPVIDGSSEVPFRISEAAGFGPGVIYRFPAIGNLASLEQRIFLSGILLGGSLSDHYSFIDRDYNMGSGFSIKTATLINFLQYGSIDLGVDFYRIFTWKGYEDKDYATINPLYLNAQGDKSDALLFVVRPSIYIRLNATFDLLFASHYYFRQTRYRRYDNVRSQTFETRVGLVMKL